ncbi:MAG: hypothetical protein WCG50_10860 [Rhodoferax sp.]|uniref:hypothetical protein n=1 Tax=Rhodoferax sp. TaxID=50421 RepID=UPI00301B1491
MISPNAQQAFNQMVIRAIQASPLVADGVQTDIATKPTRTCVQTKQVVLLTVSSYKFRLSFLIHFSPDEATYAHFSSVNKLASNTMKEIEFIDAISECGNICCGNLNRDLAHIFPHIGMSTPNIIDSRCITSLDKLGLGYLQHFEWDNPNGPQFGVSLFVNAFSELDFVGDFTQEESTGELEMF